jgi:hypothetical protein
MIDSTSGICSGTTFRPLLNVYAQPVVFMKQYTLKKKNSQALGKEIYMYFLNTF